VGHDAILTHSAPRWNPLRWSFHTVCLTYAPSGGSGDLPQNSARCLVM
jgi:hypothetical protein